MRKRILICFLSICFVFLPLTSFAAGEDVRALFADGSYPYADALYENNAVAESAKLTFRYLISEQASAENTPVIGCKAAYVADPVTGKVFYEKNAHETRFPASTTKLLTALLVLGNCAMDETAVVSANAVGMVPDGYVRADLRAGETFTVGTLLHALLIPSANDAAFVLAEHVGGSVEAFAGLCNRRAKELGCETLHFVNPNGIHNDDHYCSAYDLYLIARECQKYDVFNQIVRTKSFTVPATEIYPYDDRVCKNTNELLFEGSYYVPYCTGMKTGYTPEAGECLVASGTKDDLNLITVVLGGTEADGINERFSDTKKLLEFVYGNYAFKLIADKSQPLCEVIVKNAVTKQEVLEVLIGTDIYTVVPNEITPSSVNVQDNLSQDIEAPIVKNQVLGTVIYRADGLVYETNLIAGSDVARKPFWLYNTLVALGGFLLIFAVVLFVKKRKTTGRQ